MYKIDRRGEGGGVKKSYVRKEPKFHTRTVPGVLKVSTF